LTQVQVFIRCGRLSCKDHHRNQNNNAEREDAEQRKKGFPIHPLAMFGDRRIQGQPACALSG